MQKVVGALVACVVGLGCGTPAPAVVSFTDDLGRSCNYQQDATPSVTCAEDPGMYVTCASPAVASYLPMSGDAPMATWENCVGCRTDHMYGVLSSCGAIECSTASDCPLSHSLCTGGRCHRDY